MTRGASYSAAIVVCMSLFAAVVAIQSTYQSLPSASATSETGNGTATVDEQGQPASTPQDAAEGGDNAPDRQVGTVRFAFVDSFWTDSAALGALAASTSSETASVQPLPPAAKREVEPGEGEAVLAVVLRNRGFADATSVSASLDFPSGFRALVTPDGVDSDTALASYNGVVEAGETFTLYFRAEVTKDAKVDREYEGDLRIRYFKVEEQEQEDTKSARLEIPFRLTGRAVLSAAVEPDAAAAQSGPSAVSVAPGAPSPLAIEIRNDGTAAATGVVVSLAAAVQEFSATATAGAGADSNDSAQSPTASVPLVVVGSPTFNIGTIRAGETAKVTTTVYPSSAAGGSLQNLDIAISYNDADGDAKSAAVSLGFRVSPNPPEGGLSVTPSPAAGSGQGGEIVASSIVTGSPDNAGNASGGAGSGSGEAVIIAGKADDLNFNITNNNKNPITDVVVTLAPGSDSLEILGDSRWTLPELGQQSNARFSTRVFASESLIASPVSFDVGIQYISGDQAKSDTFSLGANVMGEIEIGVNDLAVNYIAGVPNLGGNLLNQGNTLALFTTIEMLKPASNGSSSLVPLTGTPQYLGDLEDNSPLPFNIPLAAAGGGIQAGEYPVSLVITYSDELRNTHKLAVNRTVSFTPLQEEPAPSQGLPGLEGGTLWLIIVGLIVAGAIAAIVLIRRHRSRSRISKLVGEKGDDFEESLDEYSRSSREQKPDG